MAAIVAGERTRVRVEDNWLGLVPLVIFGGISSAAYYLGFVQPYLLSTYFSLPLLDLAKINGYTAPAANEWALTWLVLFACYYLAFRLCPPAQHVSAGYRRFGVMLICGWAAVFAITLIFMYPVGAADLFDQIFRARLTSHYELNPFTTLPNSFRGDPFFPYVAWRGDASPYGPVWETLAAGTSLIGGDDLWRNLILFKVLVTAAYGVSVALTYGILRSLKPDWALRGTLFFAWNPLVLFEIPGNGHNDALLIMFVLAAVYLFVRARRTAVIPALMAGALTKFVPVLLVPIAAAAIWRDRARVRGRRGDTRGSIGSREALRTLVITALLAVALAVAFYAPFWQGWQSIGALGRQSLFTASIPAVLQGALVRQFGLDVTTSQSLVRNGALALVALVTLWLTWRVFRSRNAVTAVQRDRLVDRTLSSFYEIIFVYLAFATLWFQPWYLMWLVALTAPLARYTYANRTLLFCIGGVGNYFVWDFIWLWNRTQAHNIQITAALVVYTLPLFYSLYVWLSPFWREREVTDTIEEDESLSELEGPGVVLETESTTRTMPGRVQQPSP
ncbi:MAG: hypothetical protein M3328_01790 [Chloroflexota bacterium]|nr:hypothetical protein [Chloroflexota bacterium]